MKLRYKLFCRLKRQIIAKIRKRVRIKLQKGYFAKMRNALFLKLRAVSANKFKKKKVHSLSKRKQRIRLDNRKMNFQKVFRIPLFVRKRSPSESYKKKIRKKINRYSLIKDRLLKRKRIIDITLRNQYKSRKKHQLRENNNKYALLKTKHRYTFLNEQYKRLIFRLRKALCCNVLDTRLLAEKDEQLELLSCKRTLIQWEYAHWVDSTSLKFNLFREQFISRQIVRRSMIRWQCIKQLSAQRKIYQKRIVMCRSTLKRLITQQREIHLFLIKQKPLLRRLLKLRKKCAKRKRYIVKLLLKQPRFNTPLIKKKKRPINKRQYYERRIYKWQLNQKLKFKKQQKQFKRQNKQQYNQRNRQQNYQQYNRSKSINTQHKGLHYNRWDNRETPFYLRQNVGNKWHNNLQHYNGYKYRDVKNRKIHDKCRPKPTFIRRFKLNHLLYSIKQTMSTILLLTKVYREFFVYNIRTQHRALLNTFDSRRSLVPFINSIKRIRITFFRGGYVPTSFKMLPWYFQAKTMLSPFIKMLNSYISMHIEKVLEQYTKLNVHCLLNIFFVHRRCFAPILNAKMICDFMVYLIHDNRSVRSAFYKIRQWQIDNMNRKQRLERISYLSKFKKTTTSYLEQFAFKKYPILSIRIECSGNAKKGTMSRKFFYGDIVNSPMFIQKSPNNTFSADLDYYQSFAITKSCSIGIKVWTFFKTHLYNKNGKLRSMFFY